MQIQYIPITFEPRDVWRQVNGQWQCSAGYLGTAVADCEVISIFSSVAQSVVCQVQVKLSGCELMATCRPPTLDLCIYDDPTFPQANFGRGPGGSCTVSCRPPCSPQEGAPFYETLICPASNLNAQLPLQGTLPMCSFDCDPVDRQGGYSKAWAVMGLQGDPMSCDVPQWHVRSANLCRSICAGYALDNETAAWVCAPGYAGSAVRTCALRFRSANSQECIPEAVFYGCFPLTPRDCRFNTSAAANLTPGSIGLIYCSVPFDGVPTTAQCPWDNNQPGQEPVFELPLCEPACPKAVGQPTPPGFLWVEADKEWQCLSGYRSPAQVNCTTNVACEWLLDYGGCEKLEPCTAVNMSSCVVDASDCDHLQGGETCTLSCIAPFYVGSNTTGVCPEGNIEPDRLPDFTLPDCQVTCPDPTTNPAGYEKVGLTPGLRLGH
eukprot:g7347.t1